jgi:RNA polymerase sigma factor (sigma-70 family)
VTVNNQSDNQLGNLQRAGDCKLPLTESACAALVTFHGPMVKAACQRILGDATLAEDAAQEVFLLFVRKLPSLPPQTILGGWLYVTACHLARTHQRTSARRRQRENQAETMAHIMIPNDNSMWRELEPLLDDAMLTLSQRQRELVLYRYFQNNTQRAAAALVGCSESVASRELASAIEMLRSFFNRHGLTVSATVLAGLLTTHGAHASIAVTTLAASLSSASALQGASTAGSSFLVTLMNTTTITKVIAGAAALLIVSGTVTYLTRTGDSTVPFAEPKIEPGPKTASAKPEESRSKPESLNAESAKISPQALRSAPSASAERTKGSKGTDKDAANAAAQPEMKFMMRLSELALISDPQKVRELLAKEYGIHLSVDEIITLQKRGQKGFALGVIDLWPANQPQEALAWAASLDSRTMGTGVDLHQALLNGAQRTLPDLNRERLDQMLPDGPSKPKMLDLIEASSDPQAMANRILSETDPEERASRLRLLAQGWSNTQQAAEWARQNLNGSDKTTFYSQVSYNLAEQNPQTALQILAELKGTDAYASTFGSMMRGLVQIGGQGQQAAELIANSDLTPSQRTDLISELSRRWVRNDPDATIAWVNTLTAPEDFRAAIPLLVSQLDNDRVSRTVDAYLQQHDPVMELALIEAAAPTSLMFDPEKSRLILDPLISQDPGLKLSAGDENGSSKNDLLWNSVNLAAKRQAEQGSPTVAMDWLAKLPFASQSDYARAVGNVLTVWNIKSPDEAASWLQNAPLTPPVRSEVQKLVQK